MMPRLLCLLLLTLPAYAEVPGRLFFDAAQRMERDGLTEATEQAAQPRGDGLLRKPDGSCIRWQDGQRETLPQCTLPAAPPSHTANRIRISRTPTSPP